MVMLHIITCLAEINFNNDVVFGRLKCVRVVTLGEIYSALFCCCFLLLLLFFCRDEESN